MKRFLQYILSVLFLITLMASCSFEEENIFEDTAAVRMEKALKNYEDVLSSSPNGWAMEYFPTTSTEGYTFLMKFNKNGAVDIAAKNKYVNNIYKISTCTFDLIGDDGPVLTFNTYNNLFHSFSTPEDPTGSSSDLDGYGLEGDYEFVVLKTSTNQILVKGKKRGTIIVMNKIAADVTWVQYFENLDAMHAFLFTGSSNSLNLVSGADTLIATNGSTHIFRLTKPGEDPVTTGNDAPFIITDSGLRFQAADTIKTNSFQNFKLSEDKKRLVSTENPAVYFTGPVLNKFLYSDLSLWKADITQISDNFKSILTSLSDALKVKYAGKRNFEYIAFANKAVYGNSFLIRFTGVEAIFRVLFSPLSGTNDRVTISLPQDNINLYDNNGKKFYNEVPEIKATLDAFCGNYVVTTELPLNVKNVKYTRVNDPSIYFFVTK